MADTIKQVQRQWEDLVMQLEGGSGFRDCPPGSPSSYSLGEAQEEGRPAQGRLVSGGGDWLWSRAPIPHPRLHPWQFRDASLALEGKGLYQKHSPGSLEKTKNNQRGVGRTGYDSGYSKMPLVFLRKRCHFITSCA